MNKKTAILPVLFPIAAVVILAAWSLATESVAQPAMQPDSASAELGAPLYQEFCASCHGENLEGQGNWQSPNADGTLPAPPHDDTGHSWHHGDALLFEYTRLGGAEAMKQSGLTGFKSGMPGFTEDLTDEEIWNILAYIKSTWSDRIQELQATRSKAEQLRGN